MRLKDALENDARLFWTPFWRTDREVTKDFDEAGRLLSGQHIVALVENAEVQILEFASKAKMAGHAPDTVNETAKKLLNVFADDKLRVSQSWSTIAKEVLGRELARAPLDIAFALEAQQKALVSSGDSPPETEFDAPESDWIELWQGPVHFRATFDKGKFGPGHSLERINQYGKDGASGGGRHLPIYAVQFDPDDGAIVIEWLIGLPGRQPPYGMVRYYHGGLGRGLYERLQSEPWLRDNQLAHLPADQRERAVGAFACGITIREWVEQEFYEAVHAGHCEIWARVGSKAAPFRRIPADIFRAYEIQSWGHGVHGGAWADLAGAETLYSIRVAASEQYLAQLEAEQSTPRLTHEEAVKWCRDWMASGKGNGMDKALPAFKKLPGAGGCARDTFFRPAWNEAKTTTAS